MTEFDPGDGSDILARARSAALRLLSVRARSTHELTSRLLPRFPPHVVERVTEELTGSGLLDDAAFARQWVVERHRMKQLGRRRLEQELRGFSLRQSAIEEALGCLTEDDEARAAAQLAEKWRRQKKTRQGPAAERALSDYLLRRGYARDLVRQVVRTRYP